MYLFCFSFVSTILGELRFSLRRSSLGVDIQRRARFVKKSQICVFSCAVLQLREFTDVAWWWGFRSCWWGEWRHWLTSSDVVTSSVHVRIMAVRLHRVTFMERRRHRWLEQLLDNCWRTEPKKRPTKKPLSPASRNGDSLFNNFCNRWTTVSCRRNEMEI